MKLNATIYWSCAMNKIHVRKIFLFCDTFLGYASAFTRRQDYRGGPPPLPVYHHRALLEELSSSCWTLFPLLLQYLLNAAELYKCILPVQTTDGSVRLGGTLPLLPQPSPWLPCWIEWCPRQLLFQQSFLSWMLPWVLSSRRRHAAIRWRWRCQATSTAPTSQGWPTAQTAARDTWLALGAVAGHGQPPSASLQGPLPQPQLAGGNTSQGRSGRGEGPPEWRHCERRSPRSIK